MDKYSYSGQDSDQLISLMKERRLFLKEIINNTQKWLKAHSQKQPLCIKQRKGKTVYYITQEDGKQISSPEPIQNCHTTCTKYL